MCFIIVLKHDWRIIMGIHLIVDSCCDLSPELIERINPSIAPLKVLIDNDTEITDDGTVDIQNLLKKMSLSRNGSRSACPSAEDFAKPMREHDQCFVVTISGKLRGSYNAACLAAEMVKEEFPDKKIHVFDSKSASAGELQLTLFLHEKITEGLSFEEIVDLGEAFVKKMRTMFIVEDLGNLIKSGRLSKVSGLVASVLSICPIMGENGQGEIKLIEKVRGIQNSLKKLVDIVGEQTKDAAENSIRIVLSHCNCSERAAWLSERLRERCKGLREVITVQTSALSTLYANRGGVVISIMQS